MASKIGKRTITVIRKPKVDRLASAPAGPPPEHPVAGCAISPRASYEEERGWVIVDGLMVGAPYGSDVLATDQVRIDGKTWEVDGVPGDYEKKNGKGKAMVIYLKSVGT